MHPRARTTSVVVVVALVLGVTAAFPAVAQLPPLLGGEDPPPVAEAPRRPPPPPPDDDPEPRPPPPPGPSQPEPEPRPPPSSPPPPGPFTPPPNLGQAPGGTGQQPEAGADGELPGPPGPRTVPPDARAIIDAVVRSGPSDNLALLEGIETLVAQGISREEAIRIGFGRFPIAGRARYTHDWLFPRYGPGFRFHLGTDVFAAHGTPVRSPADGIARVSNSGLGGLAVKVFEPDGTYYYLAHLSGVVDGFTDGMAVGVGDIVGYVGTSGNARGGAPHVHLGIYPQGGAAVDPKAYLDAWLADAMARLPSIVPTQGSVASPFTGSAVNVARPFRSFAGMADLGRFGQTMVSWPQLLWSSAANPTAGGLQVAEARALDLAASIDWDEDERTDRALDAAWDRNLDQARDLADALDPLGG